MEKTLSSWKEIADHLGKGVRTIQRWEKELGLPVRRPPSSRKGIVLADPEELDAWLTTFGSGGEQTELQKLQLRIKELEKENELLKLDLRVRQATANS